MLSYELCKKLKDAGFPKMGERLTHNYKKFNNPKKRKRKWIENGLCKYLCKDCGIDQANNHQRSKYWKPCKKLYNIPTLSDLIEVLGENFGWLKYYFHNWIAASKTTIPTVMTFEVGNKINGEKFKTPEEAVANLWLALNEKKQHAI